MKLNLPKIPDPALIESMCLRYDHAHGIKTYHFSDKFEIETDEEFKNRQDANRRLMIQLYEEIYYYTLKDDINE